MTAPKQFAVANVDMIFKGDMIDNYAAFVDSKVKPGEEILKIKTPQMAELEHYAMGVAGEAGELVDVVKKHTIYGKELDEEHLIEEAGDLFFFLVATLTRAGIPLAVAIDRNVNKLNKRYEKGYTDAEAAARADKAEPEQPVVCDHQWYAVPGTLAHKCEYCGVLKSDA